jgi:hypothetical protein
MFGLSALGTIHTAISLVALLAGAVSLWQHRAIVPASRSGRWFVLATVLSCLTGFGIFRHGGFGPPHALGVLTLLVLGLVALAERTAWFGRAGDFVSTVGMSFAFFLHFIPGTTETFTRLPVNAPLFSGPDDPALQATVAVLFGIFLVGAAAQLWRLRAARRGSRVVVSAVSR